MKVNFFNQTDQVIDDYLKILKKVFRWVKDRKNLNIIFMTNDQIQELNENFRNINKPTDVLSFINEEDKKSNGDVFISLDKVFEQAKEFGHSINREISFLAVHGYLHLKGYDHKNKMEEKIMNEMTELILSYVKLGRK